MTGLAHRVPGPGSAPARRSSLRLAFVLFMSLGLATVLMLGLPLLYLTLPNPDGGVPVALGRAGRGVFLQVGNRAMRIFPQARRVDAPVCDAPSVTHVDAFVVVVKQAGELPAYRLSRVGDDQSLPVWRVARRTGDLTRVIVRPGRLPAGLYELEIPRESMFGGEDYAYVSVRP